MRQSRLTKALAWAAVTLSPRWWLQNYKTSRVLSDFINERLDSGEVPFIANDYYLILGGVELWRANYPYAYGMLRGGPSAMPNRRTILRLRKAEKSSVSPLDDQVRSAIRKVLGGRE